MRQRALWWPKSPIPPLWQGVERIAGNSGVISQTQQHLHASIERVLCPSGVKTAADRNEIEIVYEAAAWGYILVTPTTATLGASQEAFSDADANSRASGFA